MNLADADPTLLGEAIIRASTLFATASQAMEEIARDPRKHNVTAYIEEDLGPLEKYGDPRA